MANDWFGIPKVSAEYASVSIMIYHAYSCPVCRGRAVVYSYVRHVVSAKCMSCQRPISRPELVAIDHAEINGDVADVVGDPVADVAGAP